MGARPELSGAVVLVVEDEYLLALDLKIEIERAGAVVVGPVGRLADALDLANRATPLDAAVLDVDLRGDTVFPVADVLAERGIPFVFASGRDHSEMPERHRVATRLAKPVVPGDLLARLADLVRR